MEEQPATPAFKSCNTCKKKNAIPANDRRVTCGRCRERARMYYRKKNGAESEGTALEVQNLENNVQDSRPLSETKKRKIARTEYQTADGLYEAVRNVLESSYMPQFHGRFSIVMDPTISHLARARLVANSLRVFAHYPMSSTARAITNTDLGAGMGYFCRCLASESNTELQPTGLEASLHSNGVACASDQSQGNGARLAEALQASFARECKGAIRIKVLPDQSHPLGIAGQRITVDIIH